MHTLSSCSCCGGNSFTQNDILWPELIHQWGIDKDEVRYINKQQGYICDSCGSNLRSMTLASAIMQAYEYQGLFREFVKKYKELKVLELNEAGHLNQFLKAMPHHKLESYPKVDMTNMTFPDDDFDLVVHSDTLEHIENPVKALSEVRRVLKPGGFQCYTVPTIIGRLSKTKQGKKMSFHGTPGQEEYLVHNEFGANVWVPVIEAGFNECRIFCSDFPGGLAIISRK